VASSGGAFFVALLPILGTLYVTSYEPIKDGSGNVTGIYYVGYKRLPTISKRGFRKKKQRSRFLASELKNRQGAQGAPRRCLPAPTR
jgi:hypothetical protein